ncbi:MAG: hypothetical protein IH612_05395 [Desulfofustis sp.]|nr:hypothetical protein [Desulfofustis sp.]
MNCENEPVPICRMVLSSPPGSVRTGAPSLALKSGDQPGVSGMETIARRLVIG